MDQLNRAIHAKNTKLIIILFMIENSSKFSFEKKKEWIYSNWMNDEAAVVSTHLLYWFTSFNSANVGLNYADTIPSFPS